MDAKALQLENDFEGKATHYSIIGSRKSKSVIEKTARIIFLVCAIVSVAAVFSITFYMILNGTPALFKVGIKEILF